MTYTAKTVVVGEMTVFTISGVAAAQVISVDSIGESKAKIPTFTLGDTVKTNRLSNLTDVKDCKVTLLYNPTVGGTLRTWLDSGTPSTVTMALYENGTSTTAVETYSNDAAYATEWSLSGVKEDGNVEIEVTIAANDKWTASGSGS
jgi:hypothetical protein